MKYDNMPIGKWVFQRPLASDHDFYIMALAMTRGHVLQRRLFGLFGPKLLKRIR